MELEKILQEMAVQIQALNESIAKKDAQIQALTEEIAKLTARIEELTHKKNSNDGSCTLSLETTKAINLGSGQSPVSRRLYQMINYHRFYNDRLRML